mgnify:CR=1 FL=1
MFNDRSNLSRRRFSLQFRLCQHRHRHGRRRVGSSVPTGRMRRRASIKVGIATDLTGPIGYAGNADANVAKMVIKEINDAGGLARPAAGTVHRGHRVE